MLSVTVSTPAVAAITWGSHSWQQCIKGPLACLLLKSNFLPASVIVFPSGIVDGKKRFGLEWRDRKFYPNCQILSKLFRQMLGRWPSMMIKTRAQTDFWELLRNKRGDQGLLHMAVRKVWCSWNTGGRNQTTLAIHPSMASTQFYCNERPCCAS